MVYLSTHVFRNNYVYIGGSVMWYFPSLPFFSIDSVFFYHCVLYLRIYISYFLLMFCFSVITMGLYLHSIFYLSSIYLHYISYLSSVNLLSISNLSSIYLHSISNLSSFYHSHRDTTYCKITPTTAKKAWPSNFHGNKNKLKRSVLDWIGMNFSGQV